MGKPKRHAPAQKDEAVKDICHKCRSSVEVQPNGRYVQHAGYPNGDPCLAKRVPNRRYGLDQKNKAVRLVVKDGLSRKAAAEQAGIPTETVRRAVNRFKRMEEFYPEEARAIIGTDADIREDEHTVVEALNYAVETDSPLVDKGVSAAYRLGYSAAPGMKSSNYARAEEAWRAYRTGLDFRHGETDES